MSDPNAPYPPGPPQGGGYPQGNPYGQQPGYPPPQAYGPPPAYGPPAAPYGGMPPAPPAKKRKKWPWILLAVVVVLVVIGGVGAIFFGKSGSGSPNEAATKFWDKLAAHDANGAEKFTCPGRGLSEKDKQDFKNFVAAITGYDLGAETGSGNTRTYNVTVHLKAGGDAADFTSPTDVSKKSGKWYICSFSYATGVPAQ